MTTRRRSAFCHHWFWSTFDRVAESHQGAEVVVESESDYLSTMTTTSGNQWYDVLADQKGSEHDARRLSTTTMDHDGYSVSVVYQRWKQCFHDSRENSMGTDRRISSD